MQNGTAQQRAAHLEWGTFSFNGRLNRTNALVGLGLGEAILKLFPTLGASLPALFVGLVFAAAVHMYRFSVVARRLHDVGASAWWQAPLIAIQLGAPVAIGAAATPMGEVILPILPPLLTAGFVSLIIDWVIVFLPPDKGENRYGPRPTNVDWFMRP